MNTSESVQLLDYLRALRRRWRLVTAICIVTTGCALGVSLSAGKQYDATAHLLLRGDEPVNSLLDPGAGTRSNDPERDLNTEVELMKVGGTTYPVLRRLGLDRSSDALLAQIETEVSSASNIVRLRVRDRHPHVAARIANAFAEEYVRYRLASARQRYTRAAELAVSQLAVLSSEDRDSAQGRELQARMRELQIAAALQTGGAELVRRATAPSAPSRPRPKLSGAIGFMLGLLLGVGAALAVNLIDRRLKDEQEIEEFFGLPILATIPRPARRSAGADDPVQREAYGLLAANLRLAADGVGASLVLVTSPSPGEGKTSVTMGIARAYARLGLTVVAIEADLRRPAFTRYGSMDGSHGLTSVLSGGSVADQVLWFDAETMAPLGRNPAGGAVGLLPAGVLPDNPQRTLAAPGMPTVLDVVHSMADIVLIDTPPVGTVNDASVLAPFVDAILMVACPGKTTKDAARRAQRALRNVETPILGLVATGAAAAAERYDYYSSTPPPADAVPARSR